MIADGTFPQGEFLPPETKLATSYGVSRVTLRLMLDQLAQRVVPSVAKVVVVLRGLEVQPFRASGRAGTPAVPSTAPAG